MATMNEPVEIPYNVRQNALLSESEECLLSSLCKRDMDSVKLLWEIVSFYRQAIEQDVIARSLSAGLNNEYDTTLMKKFLEDNGGNDE